MQLDADASRRLVGPVRHVARALFLVASKYTTAVETLMPKAY
jgi:hypothetical protein